MQHNIYINSNGELALVATSGSGPDALQIQYELHDHLGSDASVDVSLRSKSASQDISASNTILTMVWRDSVTNDLIYKVEGIVGSPLMSAEDASLIENRAAATEAFKSFTLFVANPTVFDPIITDSPAYNEPRSLGKNKISVDLPDDQPDAFDATRLVSQLVTMDPRPAYIVLPVSDDLELLNACMQASAKLNIPLKSELDPEWDLDQAASYTASLDADTSLLEFVWSMLLARPRDAVSLRGAKKPRRGIGSIIGDYLLRNARIDTNGIPPIHTPIAGPDYPLKFKGMEMRTDILVDEDTVERLAVAKINPLRQERYDAGTLFVVADVLTQYKSADSALRLSTSAEIVCYTTNRCLDILKGHLLRRSDDFLERANRDITSFLNNCASAKIIVPGDDLGGKAYQFSIQKDPSKPFERVRFYLARCPNGVTRSVITDEDVVVK